MAEGSSSSSGNKRKGGDGGKSEQKHKFYKRAEGSRGRGGGRGGGGRGGRGGHQSNERREHPEGDRPKPRNPLGIYRDKVLPNLLTAPGISVTAVQNKERSAEQELIQYLEQIADELYPETKEVDVDRNEDAEVDFEEQLKRDLEAIGGEKTKSSRFRLCLHDTICVLYILVLPPLDPVRLVRYILEQAERTGRCPLKFCKRLLPISATSSATLASLVTITEPIVKTGFATPDDRPLKYGIVTNSRNSDKLDRMDVIRTIAEEVTKLDKGHSVDLKNPDRTIVVERHKNTLGMAVLEDYERFKTYNPSRVAAQAAQAQKSGPSTEGDNGASGQLKEDANRVLAAKRLANRSRKAEELTPNDASVEEAPVEREEGEVENDEVDLEKGELGIDPTGKLREEHEEVIADGKVVRTRQEDES